MYDRLTGDVLELTPTSAVVEVRGVGYDLAIPMSTFDRLKGEKRACIYTHVHVREDELRLYGFASKQERALFRLFLSVSGVGPSIGLACLSQLSPLEAIQALSAGDVSTMQRVKGVGKRVAERIIVDLRERAQAFGGSMEHEPTSLGAAPLEPDIQELAVRALVELGFQRKSARDRVLKVANSLDAAGGAAGLEEVVKECLQRN